MSYPNSQPERAAADPAVSEIRITYACDDCDFSVERTFGSDGPCLKNEALRNHSEDTGHTSFSYEYEYTYVGGVSMKRTGCVECTDTTVTRAWKYAVVGLFVVVALSLLVLLL